MQSVTNYFRKSVDESPMFGMQYRPSNTSRRKSENAI